jgi:hypothetical protein
MSYGMLSVTSPLKLMIDIFVYFLCVIGMCKMRGR